MKEITIDQEELYKLYMEAINRISEAYPELSSFTPKGIVNILVNILEQHPELIKHNK